MKVKFIFIVALILCPNLSSANDNGLCQKFEESFELYNQNVVGTLPTRDAQIALAMLESPKLNDVISNSCSYKYINTLIIETQNQHGFLNARLKNRTANRGAIKINPTFDDVINGLENLSTKPDLGEYTQPENVEIYNRVQQNNSIKVSVLEQAAAIAVSKNQVENDLFFLVNLAGYYNWIDAAGASEILAPYIQQIFAQPISNERKQEICSFANLYNVDPVLTKVNNLYVTQYLYIDLDPSKVHPFFNEDPIGIGALKCVQRRY